mmetsp:Transcript_124320/g.215495  ORF Transcript_124320/g.215495 Transcript_124320/m.215495 type:complete len:214 (+) Transcript_124320:307-948(+)
MFDSQSPFGPFFHSRTCPSSPEDAKTVPVMFQFTFHTARSLLVSTCTASNLSNPVSPTRRIREMRIRPLGMSPQLAIRWDERPMALAQLTECTSAPPWLPSAPHARSHMGSHFWLMQDQMRTDPSAQPTTIDGVASDWLMFQLKQVTAIAFWDFAYKDSCRPLLEALVVPSRGTPASKESLSSQRSFLSSGILLPWDWCSTPRSFGGVSPVHS